MKKKKAIWIAIIVLVAVLLALAGGCFFLAEHTDIPKLYFEGDITQMLEKSDVRSISFEYRAEGQVLSGFAELKSRVHPASYMTKRITPSNFTRMRSILRS